MAHPNARLTPATRLELVLEVEAGWSQAEVARRFRVSRATVAKWWAPLPGGGRGRAPRPQLCSAFQPPPHRSRARGAHLRRAPQPGVRAAPHRLGARDRPLHRLRRAQALRSQPPRSPAPREQAPAALRAPRPRRPAAYRREEAGPHPRRRRAPRARPLRRDPAHPRPRLPPRRRRRPQPLRLCRRPARRARPQLRRLPRAGARRVRPPWRARCAACSPTTRRPTPSPATSAAWPRPLAWHCGTPGPTARRRTARPSASSRPCRTSGPTPAPYRSNAERLHQLPRWLYRYNARRPHGGIGGAVPASRL